MAADEILGISGQLDISDIQQSFDKLINDLNLLGVKTDEVCSKMTKALNEIAQSSASDSEKTKQSVQTLKQGIEEINKSLADTPEALKKLASEAQTAEATIDKLKKRLSETTEGSQKWNEINEQLKSQQSLVEKLNDEYLSMLGTFGNTQQYVGTLNAAIDTLNAGRSISTAATGANATAHVGAAAAVATEAVAHGENSTKIAEETRETQENTLAKLHLTESGKDYVYTTQMEAEAIDAVAKRLAEGRSDEEEYINSKKSGLDVRESLVQKIEEEKQKIKELADAYANSQDANNGVATPEVQKEYNEGVKEATDNIKEYRSELSSLNQSLDNLESSHLKAQRAINEQTDATQNLRQATEEAKNASDIYFNGEKATIEGVTEALKLDYQELKQLKAEYATYKGAGDTENAKKNLEEQKELNKHISEGRDVLKQLGTSYEEAAKGAKKTKEETKEVAASAGDAAKKVGGIFSKFKSVLGGALKGDFSGLFSIFGKIGIWGAALGALGKGIYELTIRAEEFRNALQPLSHYLNDGTLQEVKQNIIALSDETGKSVSDMAKAAAQFVKVWDSLRDSSEAITTMIKSSNEFGALAGKTSEEGAKFLSNLASEYHMTAQESTEASSVIATASHNSTSNFGEMADAISSAGSSAALYGVSFKEMATLIGYSSNQFGGAQKAASKFSMLLMSMSKMQDKYNPSVVGMITALQNLKEAYDRGEHVENNFMARQRSVALYFIKNANAIAQYNKGIGNNTAKQELLNDINARASVNVAKLQNAWDGFLTSINANLTPTLTNILKFFTKIIGGAQKTADELNYLKNFDKNHKGAKSGMQYTESVTGGWTANFQESTVANMGARQQYNIGREEGLKLYRKQRDRLKKIYQQGLKNAQKAWKNASANAYANSASNFMLKYYNKNRSKFSEFTPQMFNDFSHNQRNATVSLLHKPINSNTDLGGNNYVPKDKTADQRRKFREEEAEREAKDLAASEKTKWDLYIAEKEAGLLRLESASEKEVAQHKLDYEKQKHAIEEEQKNLLNANIAAAKQAYDKNPENKNKKGFYASGLHKKVTLTSDQKALINAKYEALEAQENAYDLAQLKKKTQSLYDYLKEYGTFKEQQLAIAKEYDAKIKEAEAQGDTFKVKSLQAEKAKQVGTVRANEIESKIDYAKVFGEFGVILEDQMTEILKTMKDFSKTDTFKAKSLSEQKDFLSRMNELSNQYGTSKWGDINFSQLGKLINDYNQKLEKRNKAEEKLNESSKKLAEAQEAYEKAMKSGNEIQILDATGNLDIAQKKNDSNRQALANADADLVGAQSNVTDSAQKLSSTLNSLDALLQNMKSGSISNVWDSFVDFDKKVNGGKATQAVTDTIGKLLGKAFEGKTDLVSQIIGAVLNLLDVIAEQGIGGIVGGLIDSVLSAVNGLLDNILSGDFLKQIGGSLVNGIGGILDTITGNIGSILSFGALSSKGISSWFTNSNAEKVEKAINKLSDRNESLQQSIEDLNDTMKNSSGEKSVEAYKEAYKLQEEQNENYKKIAQEQAGYHGAHHSWNYYWNGFNDEETERIKKITGNENFSGNLWDLTPEEMKKLRGGAIDIWEKIKDTGKGGYGDRLADKLDDYIDQADKLQDLTNQINESLTQISFSSMRDDFISKLMDMQSTAEDFSENFAEMMQKAILRYGLENLINTDLKGLYEKWGSKMQEGQLSEDDINKFKEEYDKIVQKGIEERDYWAQITGYASQSQQTATGKAIEAITADQASSLVGIGYAIQSAVEQGNATRTQISVDISVMRNYAETVATNMSEMRDIQFEGLGQLQQIVKNTAPIILIREDIASMYKIMKDRY